MRLRRVMVSMVLGWDWKVCAGERGDVFRLDRLAEWRARNGICQCMAGEDDCVGKYVPASMLMTRRQSSRLRFRGDAAYGGGAEKCGERGDSIIRPADGVSGRKETSGLDENLMSA
jgi:hypothetical protein